MMIKAAAMMIDIFILFHYAVWGKASDFKEWFLTVLYFLLNIMAILA